MTDIFIVYETTNLINGKKYRGIHKTYNLNDGYLGSGFALELSVKKYGKENFTREILEFCNSYEELIEKEKIYVDEKWVNDTNTYNLKIGGRGGVPGLEPWNKNRKGLQKAWNKDLKIGPQNEKLKKKKSEKLKEYYKDKVHHTKGKDPWNKGKKGLQIGWNKGLKMETIVCPHCNKLVDIANGKRWHFDNCKNKTTI